MVILARRCLALAWLQPPFKGIPDSANSQMPGNAGLYVKIGREGVVSRSGEAFLIEDVAGIDASVDQMHSNSGVVRIA